MLRFINTGPFLPVTQTYKINLTDLVFNKIFFNIKTQKAINQYIKIKKTH